MSTTPIIAFRASFQMFIDEAGKLITSVVEVHNKYVIPAMPTGELYQWAKGDNKAARNELGRRGIYRKRYYQ